jgi:starch synthase
MMKEQVLRWALRQRIVPTAHFWAHVRLAALGPSPQRPRLIFTFIGRIFDQKMLLFKKKGNGGACGLQGLLEALQGHGLFVLLGSGDPEYEEFLAEAAGQYPHFIFLNGFSNELAAALYAAGDLFLMPSSFEPCGISQMLAMREGQPCLAHAVGGLKDTVRDGQNGFLFGGETVEEQVDGLIATCRKAVDLYLEKPEVWAGLRRGAAASRFPWSASVRAYERDLYGPGKSGAAGHRSDL